MHISTAKLTSRVERVQAWMAIDSTNRASAQHVSDVCGLMHHSSQVLFENP